MKEDIKAKWLEALRSGKYSQCTGQLRNSSNGHCCLGVLIDIVDPSGWTPLQAGDYLHMDHACMPDTEILDTVELTTGDADKLADMNDTDGLNFSQIADYIETNL